jgi:hypothetical protein
LTNPDGNATREVIQPVIHHTSSPRAYFVSRYYAGGNKVLVWALTNALQPGQQINRVEVTLSPFRTPGNSPQAGSSQRIQMNNLNNDVLKAVHRNNWLYFTMNDARDWFNDGQLLNSVRVVRLDISNYPTIQTVVDRVFGSNNSITDLPSDHIYYGWSALEVNRSGDIIIVYSRSGPRFFPEARFSVFLFADSEIRPSRVLKVGEGPYLLNYPDATGANELRWGDTAGACVDPSDDTTVWVAQTYASDHRTWQINNWSVWVGKIRVSSQIS